MSLPDDLPGPTDADLKRSQSIGLAIWKRRQRLRHLTNRPWSALTDRERNELRALESSPDPD